MEELICKKCNAVFSGRRNKLFCTNQCKITFNNEKYRKGNLHFNETVKEIKRNRAILRKIYEVFGSNTLPVSLLAKTELNFGCITGVNSNGQTLMGEYEIRRKELNTFYIHKR